MNRLLGLSSRYILDLRKAAIFPCMSGEQAAEAHFTVWERKVEAKTIGPFGCYWFLYLKVTVEQNSLVGLLGYCPWLILPHNRSLTVKGFTTMERKALRLSRMCLKFKMFKQDLLQQQDFEKSNV